MTSPAAALAAYVDTQSTALTSGANLFVGRLKTTPDACVAFVDWSAGQPDFTFSTKAFDYPWVEMAVRAALDDYAAGEALAATLRTTIDRMPSGSYSGLTILRAAPIDSVRAIGPDAQNRPMFSARFEVTIHRP